MLIVQQSTLKDMKIFIENAFLKSCPKFSQHFSEHFCQCEVLPILEYYQYKIGILFL